MSGDTTRVLSLVERKELVSLVLELRTKDSKPDLQRIEEWRRRTAPKLQAAIYDCFWERGTPEQSQLLNEWVTHCWGLK